MKKIDFSNLEPGDILLGTNLAAQIFHNFVQLCRTSPQFPPFLGGITLGQIVFVI